LERGDAGAGAKEQARRGLGRWGRAGGRRRRRGGGLRRHAREEQLRATAVLTEAAIVGAADGKDRADLITRAEAAEGVLQSLRDVAAAAAAVIAVVEPAGDDVAENTVRIVQLASGGGALAGAWPRVRRAIAAAGRVAPV